MKSEGVLEERRGRTVLEGLNVLPKARGSDVIDNDQKSCLYSYVLLKSNIYKLNTNNISHFMKHITLF